MSPADNAPWGFLEWAVAALASIVASATAFVWRLMSRLHTLEIAVRQQRRDLDTAQSNNELALFRLAERLAMLHDDHYRLRETIGALPNRADIRDLELRLGERLDALASRFRSGFRSPDLLTPPVSEAAKQRLGDPGRPFVADGRDQNLRGDEVTAVADDALLKLQRSAANS